MGMSGRLEPVRGRGAAAGVLRGGPASGPGAAGLAIVGLLAVPVRGAGPQPVGDEAPVNDDAVWPHPHPGAGLLGALSDRSDDQPETVRVVDRAISRSELL